MAGRGGISRLRGAGIRRDLRRRKRYEDAASDFFYFYRWTTPARPARCRHGRRDAGAVTPAVQLRPGGFQLIAQIAASMAPIIAMAIADFPCTPRIRFFDMSALIFMHSPTYDRD